MNIFIDAMVFFFQGNHIILNIFLGSIHNFAIKILKMNLVTKLSPNQHL